MILIIAQNIKMKFSNQFFRARLIVIVVLFSLSSCIKKGPDPCTLLNCQNGGTCERGVCNCPEWTIGDTCQVNIIDKVLGEYNAKYNSSFQCYTNNFVFSIEKNSQLGANYVIIKNMDGLGTNAFGKVVKGTYSQYPYRVEVPSQVVTSGSIQGDFNLEYDLIVGNMNIGTACNAVVTRKF